MRERNGTAHCTVAANELAPVGAGAGLRAGQIDERNTPGARRIATIDCNQRTGLGIDLGKNKWRIRCARGAQNPFEIKRDANSAHAVGSVAKGELLNLNGVVKRDQLQQLSFDFVGAMFETRVAKTVAGNVKPVVADR